MTFKEFNQELREKGFWACIVPVSEIPVEDLQDDTEAEIRHKTQVFCCDTPKDGEYNLTLTAPQLSYVLRAMEEYAAGQTILHDAINWD